MKKIFLFLIVVLAYSSSVGNPIVVPNNPIISEIYFDNNGKWFIEFNTSTYYYSNLDSLTIETSEGTSALKKGILTTDSIVLITSDSLIVPLYINPSGDYIRIIGGTTNAFKSERYFFFGNYQYSYVSAMNNTQSYILQPDQASYFYYLIKDDFPSIGYVNHYSSQLCGTFTGNILNCDSFPIPNAKIKCLITAYNYETHPLYDFANYDINLYRYMQIQSNNSGYFSNSTLYGRNYILTFYSANGYYKYDTTITVSIEPDSVNTYNFILNCDSVYVGTGHTELKAVEFYNYPNPVSSVTTISWRLKNGYASKNAVIKIFTSDGDLIKIIPVPEIKPDEMNSVSCDFSKFSQGNYYYNLEIDGKKIASNYIVVVR